MITVLLTVAAVLSPCYRVQNA